MTRLDTGARDVSLDAVETVVITQNQPQPDRPADRRAAARKRKLKRDLIFLSMGLPGIVVLFVFAYIPMAGSIIAFKDYRAVDGIWNSAWVGFQNFAYLFASDDAWRITRNTVVMNTIFMVVNTVLSLALALAMNEIRERTPRLAKLYQSVFFLPFVLSYVAVAAFVLAFLDPSNGILNHTIEAFGGKGVDWYASPDWWPTILTVVEAWKRIGFWTIVYFAAIIAISPEYFEAASIDGASKWQQIRFITLPTLAPLVIINLLLSIGHIFNADFGLFFQVTQNSTPLYPTTDVIDTFVYRSLTSLGNVGMAAAAGLYQALVGLVLILCANWYVRRRSPSAALF